MKGTITTNSNYTGEDKTGLIWLRRETSDGASVNMGLKYEESMKREDQQDATIRCLLLTFVQDVSTMCSHPARQRPTTATNHIQQNQNNTPNAVTGPLFS